MTGWHFVGATLRDGRPVPLDGEWLVHDGPVKICESGLHFSDHPFDALQYAAGSILCRVDVEDVVERQYDKAVARRRRILQRQDVANLLWAFARQCALDIAHLWMMPDVVREYLASGREDLRAAAWDAARDAARDAAWDAAWAAARAAARDAAWAAARAAARSAAWAAARAAAGAVPDAARDAAAAAAAAEAARDAQRDRFAALVETAFREVTV